MAERRDILEWNNITVNEGEIKCLGMRKKCRTQLDIREDHRE
jgi:hypothetical protein